MRRTLCGLLIASVFTLGACGGGKKEPTANPGDGANNVDESLKVWDTKPPWPLADRQDERIDAANLPKLRAEGSLVHYHSHLDVFDEGEPVTVPANVGIALNVQPIVISPMHTHQASGIIHVEADADDPVTLRQFLVEWGVRVTDGCIGDVCAPKPIALYVNGVKQTTAPLDFVITPNLEIALVLGTPPAEIPSTYDCSNSPQDACDQIPQP